MAPVLRCGSCGGCYSCSDVKMTYVAVLAAAASLADCCVCGGISSAVERNEKWMGCGRMITLSGCNVIWC
eukprot:6582648-Ditylum_brightwellii.AAC.1